MVCNYLGICVGKYFLEYLLGMWFVWLYGDVSSFDLCGDVSCLIMHDIGYVVILNGIVYYIVMRYELVNKKNWRFKS
jgi:hypothetical protein